jgi:DNA polymerase-1
MLQHLSRVAREPQEQIMPETLYIIDVFSLLFQVFHAIPEMSSPSGQPTNAVFGFTRDILNILKQKQPTHLICAMDSKGPGVRDGIYDQYKANRGEIPPDLVPQIPLTKEVIEAFGIPAIEHAGWEADDVIATVVTQAVERSLDVAIVTGDKDARQLLGPRVRIYFVRKDQFLDEAGLVADWGVRADQVIDFQSLVGDAVDNVPGVPLVGPKKASALLQQFGTLDHVLAHADEAPGAKLRENLKTYADQARMSRELVTLRRDLPLTVDWTFAHVGRHDTDRLVQLFRQLGFGRFQSEVKSLPGGIARTSQSIDSQTSLDLSRPSEGGAGGVASAVVPAKPKRARTLFDSDGGDAMPMANVQAIANVQASGGRKPPEVSVTDHVSGGLRPPLAGSSADIIGPLDQLQTLARDLAQQRRFVLDLVTTAADPMRSEIVGWVFFWPPNEVRFVPIACDSAGASPSRHGVSARDVADALRPVLERDGIELRGHDLKPDLVRLRRMGIDVRSVGVDAYVGSYLLDAGARSHAIEELARRHLDQELRPLTNAIGFDLADRSIAEADPQRLAEAFGDRARVAWQLADVIEQKLRADEALGKLYRDLERPLIPILAEMQFHGIRVRVDVLRQQAAELAARLKQLEDEIYVAAGHPFNIASPIQLRQVLFDELKLPVLRKTKTGASTDQEVLEQLALVHPLPAKLIEQRQFAKLKGTYLDALPELVNPDTGRIHTTFHQVAAATGRLSSSDPNLQNIPIRTAEGRRVRAAFVASAAGLLRLAATPQACAPRSGSVASSTHACGVEAKRSDRNDTESVWKLLGADYSQIELRMLAHFCNDPALVAAFADGTDIHAAVAAQVFGVDVRDVDESQRRMAKAVNFGVIYGQSPFGLAANLGISKDDAAQFIDEYFLKYVGVAAFIDRVMVETAVAGQATTILGRKRAIDGVRPHPGRSLNLPERTAINTVIQGSAADLIKQAMLNISNRLRREAHPARLLLQIHDELVFEVPSDRVADLAAIVRHEMEHAFELSVPLKVEVLAGDDWLNLKPVE